MIHSPVALRAAGRNASGKTPLALDQKIYELRKDKLKQIEALGQQPYPYRYESTHTLPQILDEYSPKTAAELLEPRIDVSVAGRIMSIRLMGKAGFAHLQQGGKRLQIYDRWPTYPRFWDMWGFCLLLRHSLTTHHT